MPEPSFVKRFLRERALSRYLSALESGEIETVIAVLEQSSQDGVLEKMIFDLHETYQTEEEFLEMVQEVQDGPDIIEIENGVFKSRLEGKLPDLRQPGRRGYRVYERIIQTLVAVLLIGCVLGSLLLYAQFQPYSSPGDLPSFSAHCLTTGASTSVYTGIPVFKQVTAISSKDIWVVGNLYVNSAKLTVQPLLEHWDGMHWLVVPGVSITALLKSNGSWNGASLEHLAVVSPNDIWVVGSVGAYSGDVYDHSQSGAGQVLIEHWNGQEWQLIPAAPGITESYSVLNDLVAISSNNIWAVGYASDAPRMHSTALLEHWDGTQWTRVQQSPLAFQVGALDRIRATSANDIWAFGRLSPLFQSFPVVEHWNGHSWSVASLSTVTNLDIVNSIAVLATNNIWLVGSAARLGSAPGPVMVVHWNGQTWSQVAGIRELGTGSTLLSIDVNQANDIWVAGSAANKRSLIVHWNGQIWKTVAHPSPAFAYLADITISGGKVWAVGGTYHNDLDQTATGALIETSC
ncbi:MAG TPA: hypothetical protein VGD98_10420 [Ktedonobacteraceae bacterium]